MRTRTRLALVGAFVGFLSCNHDFGAYDPRLGRANVSGQGGFLSPAGGSAGAAGKLGVSGSGGQLGGFGGKAQGGAGGREVSVPCGNGKIEATLGEECDDGNAVDGDGCSKTCVVECPPSTGNQVKKDMTKHICYVAGPESGVIAFDFASQYCTALGRGFALANVCDSETAILIQDNFSAMYGVWLGLKQLPSQMNSSAGWSWIDGESTTTCPITWGTSAPDDGDGGAGGYTSELNHQNCSRWDFTIQGINDTGCTQEGMRPSLCARTPARLLPQ